MSEKPLNVYHWLLRGESGRHLATALAVHERLQQELYRRLPAELCRMARPRIFADTQRDLLLLTTDSAIWLPRLRHEISIHINDLLSSCGLPRTLKPRFQVLPGDGSSPP